MAAAADLVTRQLEGVGPVQQEAGLVVAVAVDRPIRVKPAVMDKQLVPRVSIM